MPDWQERFLNVTWDEFRQLTHLLGWKISESGKRFDLIVAIARGGLTLSQLLSDSLRLPIASFTVESYRNLKQEKLPHITYGLKGSLNNKRILLVDDVCDTGKTFLRGLAYLEELGANKKLISTASLHHKPHAKYTPDFYVAGTSAWIIYPYEVHETIEQLVPVWKKEGINLDTMKTRFKSFAFPERQTNEGLSVLNNRL